MSDYYGLWFFFIFYFFPLPLPVSDLHEEGKNAINAPLLPSGADIHPEDTLLGIYTHLHTDTGPVQESQLQLRFPKTTNKNNTSTFPTMIYLYNLVFDAALFILIPNKQVCQMITSDSKTSQNYCQILPLKLIRWLTGLWFQRKMLSGSCWTQRHGKILNSKISWR